MAWYGVNRKGAYLRLCQTSSKIRLRLPRNGVSEVWQDGYRLVLLPRLAFFALWDGMGEAFVVPRATARVPAALRGGSHASDYVPTAESATVSDVPGGERLTQATEHSPPVCPARPASTPCLPDPAQGTSPLAHNVPRGSALHGQPEAADCLNPAQGD